MKTTFVDGSQIPAWVECYIVGWISGQAYETGCKFTLEGEIAKTNLLVSDNPNATTPAECIPVQLPNTAVRTALNLVDNPSNHGKKIKLYGSIEKYFGVAGLKVVTEYEFSN